MYNEGDVVRISSENDNENYDEFRGKNLIVYSYACCEQGHPGYDSSMNGMQLLDLKTEDGEEVPFSLYEYEVE
jgi:hypothetical protein